MDNNAKAIANARRLFNMGAKKPQPPPNHEKAMSWSERMCGDRPTSPPPPPKYVEKAMVVYERGRELVSENERLREEWRIQNATIADQHDEIRALGQQLAAARERERKLRWALITLMREAENMWIDFGDDTPWPALEDARAALAATKEQPEGA